MSRVTELVQAPNEIISSLVRFERQKERKNFTREICGNFSSHQVFQPDRIVSDGKLSLLGRDLSASDGGSIACLV